MPEKRCIEISYQQQRNSIIVLSLGFLMIFVAFSPIQAVITNIYKTFGYEHFGPISLAIVYVAYAFSTSFAASTLKRFGYKKIFIFGSLCYASFQCSGLIIYIWGDKLVLSWVAVTVPAFLCGLSAGLIWVAYSSYIGELSELEYRDEMFGLSVGIRSSSVLFGFILNMYLLAQFQEDVYFSVFIFAGLLSIVFFYFLPYTEQLEAGFEPEPAARSIRQEIASYFNLLTIRQHRQIYSYGIIDGLLNGYCTVVLYLVSFSGLPDSSTLTSEEYQHVRNYYLGIFLTFFGLPQGIMGFFMKYLAMRINCYQIAYYATFACTILMIATYLGLVIGIFWINCLVAFAWGTLLTVHRSNLNTLYSKHFKNNLQMFGMTQFLGAIVFACLVLGLSVLLQFSTLLTYVVVILILAQVTKDSWTILRKSELSNTQNLIQMQQKQ